MDHSISRRSFLKYAGTGAVSLAAALFPGARQDGQEALGERGEPLLLDGKAAVELLGYADAPGLGGSLVYLSVENLSARALPIAASYMCSRGLQTADEVYRLGSGVSAVSNGSHLRCGSFAAPLYAENAADASAFTLNLAAGRGALVHCFCETPSDWQTLELTYKPDFAAGLSAAFVVRRSADIAELGPVPASPAEVCGVVEL